MLIHSEHILCLIAFIFQSIELIYLFLIRTDALIQDTIRRKFADCTVLTVAHRLNTIIDSDRVLVMDAGYAVEFDTPYSLIKRPNGVFQNMVFSLDFPQVDRLVKVAEKRHNENQENEENQIQKCDKNKYAEVDEENKSNK